MGVGFGHGFGHHHHGFGHHGFGLSPFFGGWGGMYGGYYPYYGFGGLGGFEMGLLSGMMLGSSFKDSCYSVSSPRSNYYGRRNYMPTPVGGYLL